MIKNPENGLCDFKLRTFEGMPSYLTNVPIDILTAFIDYHTKGCGVVWFDEEGTEFSLVITPYSLFIIEEKNQPILHDFSDMKIENLEKELINDIEKDLNRWSEFITSDNSEENKDNIIQKISKLKKIIGD